MVYCLFSLVLDYINKKNRSIENIKKYIANTFKCEKYINIVIFIFGAISIIIIHFLSFKIPLRQILETVICCITVYMISVK